MPMIYDRTQNDVKVAIRLRSEKVQNFIELNDEEIAILEKGFITINTINRIENKQSELKTLLNNIGYYNIDIYNKTWDKLDLLTENDLIRIVNNTISLRKAFFVYFNSPKNPIAKYYYTEINSIEKILYDLEIMEKYVRENFKECNTFYCGES